MQRRLRLTALLLPLLLLFGCASSPPPQQSSATSAAEAPAPSDFVPERPLPHSPERERGFARAIQNGTRTDAGRPGPKYWQQEVDYDLTARLFPSEKRLEGRATITYTNNAPDTLDRLHVELLQSLHKPGVARLSPAEITGGVTLKGVAVDGTVLTDTTSGSRYSIQNTQLVLHPERPVSPKSSVTIEVDWRFTIPQAGASGRMGYSRDDLLFLAYWYPQMAVYDDVTGWMDDSFLGLAEFYADFGDYDLTIHAPDDWVVQATGRLQNADDVLTNESLTRRKRAYASDSTVTILTPDLRGTVEAENDTLSWHFTAEQMRDVAFNLSRNSYWDAARTPVGDRDGDGTVDSTIVNTFWRDSAPKWSEVTRYQQHALTFLSEYTGMSYPWPHMTAVEGGGIIGGGMEFPMMTIMGDYNENSSRMLYAVTAHELAHMWKPMIVNTNERRYSWMDEGTTSFNENMARRDFFDDSDAVASDRADYLQAARTEREGEILRWSNFHRDFFAFGIASYRKPATLLVALRGVLGEETFNEAFRAFFDTWAYKHPYPSDFFNTFERVSGRDLDWFWYSWYDTTWTLDQAVDRVERRGSQVAVTVADNGKVPMPVRLTVTLENGETVDRDIPVDVWLEGRTSTTTTLPVGDAAVERVEIDAAHNFPDVNRENNVWTGSMDTDRSSR